MAYQKFRADQLFDGYRMRDDQWVLIMDVDGKVREIIPAIDAGDELQSFPGIISPGFVNCHCHLELSHMKGAISQRSGLVNFVSQVMKERHMPDDAVLKAIDEAETEMIQNGIVAVGDICNNKLSLPQKLKGRILYHNFIEASGFLPELADIRFRRATEIFEAFGGYHPVPISSNSIVPHAPYSVSEPLWKKIISFPGNLLLTIHNQETEAENNLFLEKTGDFLPFYEHFKMDAGFFKAPGKTSLQANIDKFLPNQQVIFVHNVYTSASDIAAAQKRNDLKLFWCLCPNANLYITGNLPNIELFIKKDCQLVLGTDSLASNRELNILSEMRTLRERFPFTNNENLFAWATINGAKALQMDHILGSFETGKKPGVILCNAELTHVRRLL